MFGGRSPEHDVSIITGLQAIQALDPVRYEAIPIYIAPNGEWLVGDSLMRREIYIPDQKTIETLTAVTLDLTPRQTPALISKTQSIWQKTKIIEFDVALLAFHGLVGEDGGIQGLFETAHVPYTGMRTMASSVLMDKAATKKILAGTQTPVLPCWEIKRPIKGYLLTVEELSATYKDVTFPCCIKPAHLGSSIGVARVTNWQEVSDVLASSIFRYDDTALLEPFVENLVEYNVSVRREGDTLLTSAIERPKRSSDLLDFKTKYMAGGSKNGGTKSGNKTAGQSSEGMLSLTRDINPDIPIDFENNIRAWAKDIYASVGGSGVPRLDFLSNEKTGEIWFNEANPMPGSYGYFLWEAASEKALLFSELLDHLIEEAFYLHRRMKIPPDPTPSDARLFPRR